MLSKTFDFLTHHPVEQFVSVRNNSLLLHEVARSGLVRFQVKASGLKSIPRTINLRLFPMPSEDVLLLVTGGAWPCGLIQTECGLQSTLKGNKATTDQC